MTTSGERSRIFVKIIDKIYKKDAINTNLKLYINKIEDGVERPYDILQKGHL